MRSFALCSLSLTLLSWVAIVRSQNCQLQVPANPLSAQGLATPYVLTGCNQLDFANQGAFVEAAILDPATGNIQIYSPLVINAGMTPVGNGTGASASSAGAMSVSGMPMSSGSTNVGATASPSNGASTSGAGAAPTTGVPTSAGSTNVGTTATPSNGRSSVASSATTSDPATATMAARQAATAGFFIPPIVPTLPANAVVGIWFGSNAASLTLTGDTGGCVNGVGSSVFGQFAYCNGQAWFNAAKTAVSQGLIKLPAPGTGSGGQACPTTHDFRVVDQDQSDNVVTTYLLIGTNTLAQNTPDNNKANPNAEVLSNASDNALITQFIDPALGCAPFQNPCTTCPTGQGPALATDELLANFFPPAGGPALVPFNDPMVLVNGQQSLQKVNLYRDGTGQPQADNQNASALTYCQQISQSGMFINNNQKLFANAGTPAANMANNLFTFLAMRFSASFGPAPGLGCTGLLNVQNPVTLTMDGNGVVTAATINTQSLQQILTGVMGNITTTTSSSATSSTASASAPATASSGSARTTVAGSTTASPTGVLLHPTTTASSASSTALNSAVGGIAGSATATSAASGVQTSATATSASSTMTGAGGNVTNSVPTPTASGVQTSATATLASSAMTGVGGNVTNSAVPTSTASGVQTSAVAASASATMTGATGPSTRLPTTSCTGATTVTVTVTAMACPTQSSAAASATPTTYNDGWNDGWDGGWNSGWNYKRHWKRSTPFTADRMRRKSRTSFG